MPATSPALLLTLGSSSPSRRALFSTHFAAPGRKLAYAVPDVDEAALGAPLRHDPAALTRALAHAKADALCAQKVTRGVLITSDQVAVYRGEVREKPRDAEECRRFLRSYATAPVETVNTVVVTDVATQRRLEGKACAVQHWRPIPEVVIDAVLAKQTILHCAGGFMVEEDLLQPYLGERTGPVDALLGFPINLTKDLVRNMLALIGDGAAGTEARLELNKTDSRDNLT